MDLNEYKKKAWKTAIYPNKGNNIYYPALGLGEAGEIQNKVKKIMRDDNGKITEEKRKELIKEIGDLLWYIAALANELDVDLNEIAEENIKKLTSRAERGKLKGSGDGR